MHAIKVIKFVSIEFESNLSTNCFGCNLHSTVFMLIRQIKHNSIDANKYSIFNRLFAFAFSRIDTTVVQPNFRPAEIQKPLQAREHLADIMI